jgi:hypothetical protein
MNKSKIAPHRNPDVDTSVKNVHGTELAVGASRVLAGFLNAKIFFLYSY